MEPGHHDRIFAEISHLPHVVAYALVHAVGSADVEGENVLSYTAGGFRDFTRIASSDPAMWRDIALMNRDALLASIDGFSKSLAELRNRIEAGDSPGTGGVFHHRQAVPRRDRVKLEVSHSLTAFAKAHRGTRRTQKKISLL